MIAYGDMNPVMSTAILNKKKQKFMTTKPKTVKSIPPSSLIRTDVDAKIEIMKNNSLPVTEKNNNESVIVNTPALPVVLSKTVKKPSSIKNNRSKPVRPSLSDQLAAIGDQASDITKEIKRNAGIVDENNECSLYTCPAKSFCVGALNSKYSSNISFFINRCEYRFHHPYVATEIHMVMWYKDMSGVTCSNNRLSFRVPSSLIHFAKDYNPNNANHNISIEFATSLSQTEVKSKVMPRILKR